MKKGIHPTYIKDIKVTCSTCGAVHVFGGTNSDISIEICSKCHPAYTGKQTVVDTAGMVERFKSRQAKSSKGAKAEVVGETAVESAPVMDEPKKVEEKAEKEPKAAKATKKPAVKKTK